MRAQNFNFAPKFLQNGALIPKFCLLDEITGQENSSKAKNLGERGALAMTPLLLLQRGNLVYRQRGVHSDGAVNGHLRISADK